MRESWPPFDRITSQAVAGKLLAFRAAQRHHRAVGKRPPWKSRAIHSSASRCSAPVRVAKWSDLPRYSDAPCAHIGVKRGEMMPKEEGGVMWRASTESSGIKCFTVSLHRTGTRSMSELLSQFCSVLQYPVRHKEINLERAILGRECDLEFVSDTLESIFGSYESVTDVPIPVIYRQLLSRYPRAKFILLLRSPLDWVPSVRRHIGARALALRARAILALFEGATDEAVGRR
jgi:hypothetical protein